MKDPLDTSRPFDLLCMGSVWAELRSDQIGASLEDATSFSLSLGGAAIGAVGLCRLGLKTSLLGRIGDEAIGRYTKKTLQEEGVDTSFLSVDTSLTTGLALKGANPPDHFPSLFFRNICADTAFGVTDLKAEAFAQAKALLITSNNFATSGMSKVTKQAIDFARESHTKVILNIAYIPLMWEGSNEHTVRDRLKTILNLCDLVVGTEEELCAASGTHYLHSALEALRKDTPATIIHKRGANGCVVYGQDSGDVTTDQGWPIKALDISGDGDAFLCGFLRGWLTAQPLTTSCAWATACSAIVTSRNGCLSAFPYWEELQSYLRQPIASCVVNINHQHYALSHHEIPKRPLCVLAFDHRIYFQTLIARQHRPARNIVHFKKLLYRAVQQVIAHEISVDHGIMIDDEFGQPLLKKIDASTLWCARCIEAPMSFPVTFLHGREASHILRLWPRGHRVKVLSYQPSIDEHHEYAAQTRSLRQLYEACVDWGHQLVVEVAAHHEDDPQISPLDAIETYYRAGIFPTWWQLPVTLADDVWERIHALIRRFDPYCRGVLVIGKNEPIEIVKQRVRELHLRAPIAGFAVGRSIWGNIAERWFAHEMEDDMVVDEVAKSYLALIDSFASTHAGEPTFAAAHANE